MGWIGNEGFPPTDPARQSGFFITGKDRVQHVAASKLRDRLVVKSVNSPGRLALRLTDERG